MPNNNYYPDKGDKATASSVDEALKKVKDLEKEKSIKKIEDVEEKKSVKKIEEAEEDKKKIKKSRNILRYYNSSQLIPVSRSQVIPGNYYVFEYSNYKHVPTPLVLYIGTNMKYSTLEGISMQYFNVKERYWIEGQLGKMGLHNERAQHRSKKVKNLINEEVHIYRNTYSSDSIYRYLKRKLENKIYFYRRYKFKFIKGRIYLVPIEKVKEVLSISTPVLSLNKKLERKEKKKTFNLLNWVKSKFKKSKK